MRLRLLSTVITGLGLYIQAKAQTLSSSLYFETNESVLSSAESSRLSAFLKSLDTLQIRSFSITAYCDDRGSEAYNKALATKRADFIKQTIASGASGLPIQTEGKGELALRHMSDSVEERRKNRRAELSVSYSLNVKKTMKKAAEQGIVAAAPEKKTAPEKKEPILSDDQKVGDKVTLENILFAGGRHILLPESYESLASLKDLLLEKTKYHIMILGHICCIRSGEDGIDFDTGKQNLSVARARAVYNYLVENGVSPGRLSYKGMRAKYPTGRSDREDRRVEIEITKIDGE